MKYWILFLSGLVLFSCNEESSENVVADSDEVKINGLTGELASYYYTNIDKKPQIYVYADSLNPVAEQIERVYHLLEDSTLQLVIEKYNAQLRIKEAYSLKLDDSLRFFDHMIVDRTAKKRKAKVEADRYFPLTKTEVTNFVSHFPGVMDSTVMINDVKSHYVRGPFKMNVLGEEKDVILVKDTVTWIQVNPATNLGNTNKGVIDRYYAKEMGLVAYGSEDGTIMYNLQRILKEEEWQAIINP